MIMVDSDAAENRAWGFKNQDGKIESVELELGGDVVYIHGDTYGVTAFYAEDIPNLVKALQAAYKQFKEN